MQSFLPPSDKTPVLSPFRQADILFAPNRWFLLRPRFSSERRPRPKRCIITAENSIIFLKLGIPFVLAVRRSPSPPYRFVFRCIYFFFCPLLYRNRHRPQPEISHFFYILSVLFVYNAIFKSRWLSHSHRVLNRYSSGKAIFSCACCPCL